MIPSTVLVLSCYLIYAVVLTIHITVGVGADASGTAMILRQQNWPGRHLRRQIEVARVIIAFFGGQLAETNQKMID